MAQWTDDQDWTEALDEFLAATQTGLTVFAGLLPQKGTEPFDTLRRQVAGKIASNMFQFVEHYGAQGGKHAEGQPRPGTESGSAEPGGPAEGDRGSSVRG